MIKRYGMFFRAGDDGGGGGTVIEAPPAMAPVGDVYKAALAKEQGEPSKEPVAAATKEPAAAKEPAAKKEDAPIVPPKTALEAALGDVLAEKKDEPATDPLKDFPEEPTEGQKRNWKGLRGVAKTALDEASTHRAEVARLTEEIKTARITPPELAQENAALKKTLDSYKDAIVAINLNLDPEHRAKFVDGRVEKVNKAASKLDAYGGKGELLKDALGMPEGRARTQAIKEALGDLEDVERSRVLQFVGEVEKLDDERAELEKDPQQAWEKLQRTQTELRQKQADQAETYKKDVFDKVTKTLPTKLTLLKTVDPSVEGATEWNNEVQAIKENAFKLLGADVTPEQLAEAALWATAGPKLQKILVDTNSELTKVRSALKQYEESEPGFRGGKQPQKTPAEAKLEKTAGEVYAETLAAQQNREN